MVTANQTGGTLNVTTGNAITNNGRFVANSGILNIVDNLTGTGRIEITNGGTAIVDQGTDQKVVFVGASADTLALERREASGGSFNFDIVDMGVGDRIRFDIGYGAGSERAFTFTPSGTKTLFADAVFADGVGAATRCRWSASSRKASSSSSARPTTASAWSASNRATARSATTR